MFSNYPLVNLYAPWIIGLSVIFVLNKLIRWAKKRRSAAVIIGLMAQMFLPDPRVDETIRTVQEQKQPQKKQQDGENEPFDLP